MGSERSWLLWKKYETREIFQMFWALTSLRQKYIGPKICGLNVKEPKNRKMIYCISLTDNFHVISPIRLAQGLCKALFDVHFTIMAVFLLE